MRKLLSVVAMAIAAVTAVLGLSSGTASAASPVASPQVAPLTAVRPANCDGGEIYTYDHTSELGVYYYQGSAGDLFITNVWRGRRFTVCIG